jgi:hypothetical protein
VTFDSDNCLQEKKGHFELSNKKKIEMAALVSDVVRVAV